LARAGGAPLPAVLAGRGVVRRAAPRTPAGLLAPPERGGRRRARPGFRRVLRPHRGCMVPGSGRRRVVQQRVVEVEQDRVRAVEKPHLEGAQAARDCSMIAAAISRDAVAAGDGALSKWTCRGAYWMMKSSASEPSGRIAWARTPLPEG